MRWLLEPLILRRSWLLVPICFLCSASALPELLLRRRVLPFPPKPEDVAWQEGRSWYHNMKNQTAESFQDDSSYYSKLMCFLVLVLAVLTAI